MIFYHNISKKFVEIIQSGAGYVCIVELKSKDDNPDLDSSNAYDTSSGKVIRGNKRQFKRFFSKASNKKITNANLIDLPPQLRQDIKNRLQSELYYILHEPEVYSQ